MAFFPVTLFIFVKFMLVIIPASITLLPPEWDNATASWCNGSTTDFDSVCLGSNPSEAIFSKKLYFIRVCGS